MQKIVTILFSVTVGIILIGLGAAVFLPSTKRAHFDYEELQARQNQASTQTSPEEGTLLEPLPGTKSGLVLSGQEMRGIIEGPVEPATQPDRLLPGTKVGVFDTSKPIRQTIQELARQPATQLLDPSAQPTTRPATLPAGSEP